MAKKAKKNFFLQKTGIKGIFERNKGGFCVNFSLQKRHARKFWPSACSRNELSTSPARRRDLVKEADDESAGATIADTARANKPRNVVLRRGIDVNAEFKGDPRDSIGASPLQNDSGDDNVGCGNDAGVGSGDETGPGVSAWP